MKFIQFFAGIFISCFFMSCNNQANANADDQVKTDSSGIRFTPPEMIKDTVNKPEPVFADAEGRYHLTAENGRAIGPDIKYMPEWSAFGWFTANDRVEWDISVNKAGKFNVILEWSVSDEEAGKEFVLESGKESLTGTVDKSGSWETFKTKSIGQISLTEGSRKLVFSSKTKFDKGALLDLRGLKLLPVN